MTMRDSEDKLSLSDGRLFIR